MSKEKTSPTPATPPSSDSGEPAAIKKPRATRTRKPAAATVEAEPIAVAPAAEEKPAPVKKRAPAKSKAVKAEPAPVAETSAAAASEPPPVKARPRAAKKVKPEAVPEAVAPLSTPSTPSTPSTVSTVSTASTPSTQAAPPAPAKPRTPRPPRKKPVPALAESQPFAPEPSPPMAVPAPPEPPEVNGNVAEPRESKEAVKSSGRQRNRKRAPRGAHPIIPEVSADGELILPPALAVPEIEVALPELGEGESQSLPAKRGKKRNRKSSAKRAAAAAAESIEGEGEELDEERESEELEESEPEKPAVYKLLINAEEPEECRIALLENGKLESFHVETVVNALNKGNIYKGKIVAVEANLQAAFVDLGTGKNGFLPFSDIHPEYYNREISANTHWKDLHIQDVVSKGTEVLVEVVKETTGNKGANLTTFLSLPGRFVVLMPGSDSHGISRKIDSEEQRATLREMMASCNLPEGVGYIIRTASKDITKVALTNDVKFLLNLWKEIKHRGQTMPSPALVFQEEDIIARFLRDHFTPEIHEILVDSQAAFDQVSTFLELLPPNQCKHTTVKLHRGSRPIINQYNVEEQIEQIYQPTVKLPSGGSIVINPTEALVAIDVNSGRTSKDKNFDETIFLANMEAAEELGRQLRLRDLGGLIVVDFIDMRIARHIREVEKKVKSSMKRDKAKVDFSRISKFGLMQISRQRLGAPIQAGNYNICSHCQGRGITRSVETQALACLRQIQTAVTRKNVGKVNCRLPLATAQYLLNKKRSELSELEKLNEIEIFIETDATMTPEQVVIDIIKKER